MHNNIRKAVIPAAGFGTRLFPATKALKKELFPIVDRDGRAKPIIQVIVEEAISAGIEEVGIVCASERSASYLKTTLKRHPSQNFSKKLKIKNTASIFRN